MWSLPHAIKSLSPSSKWMLVSMVCLGISSASSHLSRVEKQKEQAAVAAFIQKRGAELDKLSGDMERTSAEMKRLDASGKLTDADLKRFKMQSAQYKVRLKAIEAQPCPCSCP